MRRALILFLTLAIVACPMPCPAFGMECEIANVETCVDMTDCPLSGSCAPVPTGPSDQGFRLDAAKLVSPAPPDVVLAAVLPSVTLRAFEAASVRAPHLEPHVPRFLELQVFRL
ncbi:MAG: hypothetical protein ACREOU_13460 [Candidatus Eiseniibacteriota bacterium]